MEGTGKFIAVAKKSDIPAGSAKTVDVEGRSVALVNVGGKFYAIDGRQNINALGLYADLKYDIRRAKVLAI